MGCEHRVLPRGAQTPLHIGTRENKYCPSHDTKLRRQENPEYCWNSMIGSERPSPEPLLKKGRPQFYRGVENCGNALEASYALNYRIWGPPPRPYVWGNPRNRGLSGISNGRGRFGGQTAGGHYKAFPRPRQPLFLQGRH